MSAIFGIYNIDGKPVSDLLLEKMSESLSHRGADSKGIFININIGLGHRMLWTTLEAHYENLPNVTEDKAFVITAHTRLDNRKELKNLLGISDHKDPIPDSKIILEAYKKWGERCPKYLLGDFAFVIWDSRQKKLFCVRDRFGVKPLYYYHLSNKLFVFATEIKALLSIPDVPREVNDVRVFYHLNSDFEDRENTFYKNILRLQPGHILTIDQNEKKTYPYWNLSLPPKLKLKSDDDYAEALLEHFTNAVRRCLSSSVPVGAMLSGGLDSSSITCMARKILAENGETKQLHTFSAIFDKSKVSDEREYMNAVIRGNNIYPHFNVADNYGPFYDADRMLQYQDEPIYSGNLYLNWLSYKTARDQGIKVILDGFDGDNTISHGTGLFTELAHEKRWVKFTKEIVYFSKKTGNPWTKVLWSWFLYLKINPLISSNLLFNRAQKGFYRINKRMGLKKFTKANGSRLGVVKINPAFKKRVKEAKFVRNQKNSNPRTEREMHLHNLLIDGNPYTLEVLDRAASAFSIEVRFPFWDKDLIDFCLSVPANQKIKNGWTRLIMRRAMSGIIPPEIQWRPGKSDLSPSFNYGFLKYGQDLMKKFIIDYPEKIDKYVDIDSLRKAYQSFLSSEASNEDIMAIQRSISLALWLQKQ